MAATIATVYVITRKLRRSRVAQPLCYQDTHKDAALFVRLLRDDDAAKRYTYGIRPVRRGVIKVEVSK